MKHWKVLQSGYLFRNRWVSVRRDHVVTGRGVEINDYYVVEYPDWVNVLAITEDGRFIMEEQYRHGLKTESVELCAGICEKGEAPIDTARRELLEETGYTGGEWIEYGVSAPNSGAMSNRCYTFLARGVRKTDDPRPEPTEDIAIHLLTSDEVKKLLLNGKIIEAVMQTPLWRYFAEQSLK